MPCGAGIVDPALEPGLELFVPETRVAVRGLGGAGVPVAVVAPFALHSDR